MTLLKLEALKDFNNLGNKIQHVFGEFPNSFNYQSCFLPKIDISEDEKNIYFEADIPGIKKEDVNITLKDNVLTIKGKKKNQSESKEKTLIRNERMFGSFNRSFTLHEEINPDSSIAEFENGILKVVLEKAKHETVKERNIEVK